MGGSFYDPGTTRSFVNTTKAATGGSAFAHAHAVRSGKAKGIHETLDPSKPNKAGKIIRESRDSDQHPESEAFAVAFDVTGSMGGIPTVMVEKLPALMGMLMKKGVSEHPQVLFAAVGDAQCDRYPIQIGQFESGNELDAAFTNIILEGGGGGQVYESYDLMMYYMAYHTSIDCYEKRGVKGMLFLIGDEMVRKTVRRSEVKQCFGVDIPEDIPIETVMEKLTEMYEVFYIFPNGSSHYNDDHINKSLQAIFGERVIKLEDPDAMCETICSLASMLRGQDEDTIKANLKDSGATDSHILAATTAIAPFKSAATAHLSMVGQVTGGSLADLDATVGAAP